MDRDTPPPFDLDALTWLELGEAHRLLIDRFPRLAMGLDLDGRIRWINPAGAQALSHDTAELAGQPLIGTLLRQDDVDVRAAELSEDLGIDVPADAAVFSARLRQGLADDHAWVLRRRDGEPRPTHLSLGTLRNGQGGVVGLLAVESEGEPPVDAPIPLTLHDSLTGLPSRAVLADRAEMAMQRAARAGTRLGVLLIELEGFDELCERHGPTLGDDLLRATAGRLHFELRKTDTAVRLDRGQFVALLVDIQEAEQAEMVAHKVASALAGPVNTGVEVLHPSARVGVAVYPEHGDQLLPLLQAAESALRADDHGRVAAVAVAVPAGT